MANSAPNYDFYHRVVTGIGGWLEKGTAIRTMDILEFQEQQGLAGSLLEIGVWRGAYLSILLRSATRTNSRVVGVDLFSEPTRAEVQQTLQPLLGSSRAVVILVQSPSVELDANALLQHLGQKARFISVDGSHERNDVHWDLCLAEELTAPGGVVAVDDFINPSTFGVNEAVHVFFSQPRRLVPWAYIENKLFLCHPSWSARYRQMLEAVVMADEVEPHSKHFREFAATARNVVEQVLWGAKLLILTP